MMLGRGVGLAKVVGMTLRGLVGKFSYKAMRTCDIESWAVSVWGPILGYYPTIYVFQKGWFRFIFRSEAHTSLVLDATWMRGQGSLMLQRRNYGFDPATEGLRFRHIWVLLLDVPTIFWNREDLMAIGNHIGHCIHLNEGLLNRMDKHLENY